MLFRSGMANSIITGKNPLIYDGSWSEYGLKKNENIRSEERRVGKECRHRGAQDH